MAFLGLINNMISKTLLFFFISIFLSKPATALLPSDEVYHSCLDGTYDPFQKNSLSTTSLLSDLAAHSSSYSFYPSSSSAGGLSTTTYGLFYCTGNIGSQDCNTCVQRAVSILETYCQSYKAAVVFYEDCTLRYSNSTVYATLDTDSLVAWIYNIFSVSYTGFNQTLYATLNTLITEAAYGPSSTAGFATAEAGLLGTTERLYALAQCTPDIVGSTCQKCLQIALEDMPLCCTNDSTFGPERISIMTFLPSCQLRYEVKYPSANDGSIASSPGKIIRYIMLALAVIGFALR